MARRTWSPVPVCLADDEAFLALGVHATDLLFRLYSWGADAYGRCPAGVRALLRRTGAQYDIREPLASLVEAGLVAVYTVDGRDYLQILGYDDGIPRELQRKRGSARYPERPTEAQGRPNAGPRPPPDVDLYEDKDLGERERVRDGFQVDVITPSEPLPDGGLADVITPILPSDDPLDGFPPACRPAAKSWAVELDLQRKTYRPGRSFGVLGQCGTWETCLREHAIQLIRLAREDEKHFPAGVERMIDNGEGWIMNPVKYLRGAITISAKNGQKRGRLSPKTATEMPEGYTPVKPTEIKGAGDWFRED